MGGVELDEIWQTPQTVTLQLSEAPLEIAPRVYLHSWKQHCQTGQVCRCSGLSGGPRGRVCIPTLGSGGGTLLGRRVFEDVIEDLGMRNLPWITWWALNPTAGVLLRGRLDRHGKRGTQRRRPRDKGGRGWGGGPRAGRGREDPRLEPWGSGPQGLEGQGGPREPCREHSLLPP